MATRNDVTGDAIVSRASNDKYADGWDRIFGKNKSISNKEIDTCIATSTIINDVNEDFILASVIDDNLDNAQSASSNKDDKIFDLIKAKVQLTGMGVPPDGTKTLPSYDDPRWSKEKEFKLPAITFTLSEEEYARAQKWLKEEVYPDVIEEQKKDPRYSEWKYYMGENGEEYPYSGSIGCAETYMFTQTSVGLIIKVRAHGREYDITDYDKF